MIITDVIFFIQCTDLLLSNVSTCSVLMQESLIIVMRNGLTLTVTGISTLITLTKYLPQAFYWPNI